MICCGGETCERRPADFTAGVSGCKERRASAALDGADIAVADDSPMGPRARRGAGIDG